jgi:hypothetical protein
MKDENDENEGSSGHPEEGPELAQISTGSAGLDEVLGGGLDPERMYLYEGRPGSGKTTLALQFLLEGVTRGEPTLYITLSETERELRLVAKRHGWSLQGVTVFELVPPETNLDPAQELTILHPAETELSETSQLIFDKVESAEALAAAMAGERTKGSDLRSTRVCWCPKRRFHMVRNLNHAKQARRTSRSPGLHDRVNCNHRRIGCSRGQGWFCERPELSDFLSQPGTGCAIGNCLYRRHNPREKGRQRAQRQRPGVRAEALFVFSGRSDAHRTVLVCVRDGRQGREAG